MQPSFGRTRFSLVGTRATAPSLEKADALAIRMRRFSGGSLRADVDVKSAVPITDRCCGAQCFREGQRPDEPCWGHVHAIEEIPVEDGDYVWMHACDGHETCWDEPDSYKPEPTTITSG